MKPKFKLLKLLNIAEMYIIDLERYEKIRQTMQMTSCIQLYLLEYQKNIDVEILKKVMHDTISISDIKSFYSSEIKFNSFISSI